MGPIITFLSDFGLADEWVGVCKGVVKGIAPHAEIIDISHEVPNFNVKKGALLLASAVPFMPKGIHLAVVDPGVGTKRRAIIILTKRGDYLIGPDNGLLIPTAQRLGGIKRVVEITNERYMHKPICPSFHGRDIFAPAAAHLAAGKDIDEFGPEIDINDLVQTPWSKARISGEEIICEVIDVDKFGTLRLNVTLHELMKCGIRLKNQILVKWDEKGIILPLLRTFGEVKAGELLLLVDSSDHLCIAVNQGSASVKLGLKVGSKITLIRERD
ncbi:MAG: SAM-dependent chlorinase/fluorinase [Actinomycetota bacterium]|nr:SAM-dependent chlorinase/fluorinase [Actinomycetota bacterium]